MIPEINNQNGAGFAPKGSVTEALCLEAALEYARQGFSVIPLHGINNEGKCTCGRPNCASAGKHPIASSWKRLQTQALTEVELRAVYGRYPRANVGIVTGSISGVVVLDIDGLQGIASTVGLFGGDEVISGPAVKTGGGGYHLYYLCGEEALPNFARKLPGLDFRGEGGYVVAPPSRHHSRNYYEWVEGCALDEREVPSIAEPVLGLFQRPAADVADVARPPGQRDFALAEVSGASPAYGRAALQAECQNLARAPIGAQENTLNTVALKIGGLVGSGHLDRDVAIRALTEAGLSMSNETGRPPWTRDEIGKKVHRAFDQSSTRAVGPHDGDGNDRSGGIGGSDNWHKMSDPTEFESLDLSITDQSRRAPPDFPVELLGSYWSRFVMERSEGTAPKDYVAAALMVSAAALIGMSRAVSPWPEWTERSILWALIVGSPSAGKTPALNKVMPMVTEVERRLGREHADLFQLWEEKATRAKILQQKWQEDVDRAKADGDEPPPKPDDAHVPAAPNKPRVLIQDATVEAVARILSFQHRGLLLVRDEGAGWIGSMNKYGGSGERPFWLETYTGGCYTVDRVKYGEPIEIPYNAVSVFAGIQPERLNETLLTDVDDGFVARFLYVWPEPIPPKRPAFILRENDTVVRLEQLARLEMQPPTGNYGPPTCKTLLLTNEAADAFEVWRSGHFRDASRYDGMVAGHWGKLPGLVLRLALVLEHLWWCGDRLADPEPISVGLDAVKATIRLVEEYFKPMALRVFGDAAVPIERRKAATLARWIKDTKAQEIVARDVYRTLGLPGLKTSKDVDIVISELIDAGWLRLAGQSDRKGGRPRKVYAVNPQIFEAGG